MSKKPKIKTLQIVVEQDLKHAAARDFSYDGPSYGGGEAEWVLCTPAQLVEEFPNKKRYAKLIKELSELPKGVLVALEG